MSYQRNKSIRDGLEVLNALAAAGRPVGSREVGRMLGLEPTRANRILQTLAEIGMAEQDTSRKYLAGPGIHLLSSLAMNGSALLKTALPIMEKHRNPRYVMALGVLWRDKVSYLVHAAPGKPLSQGLGSQVLYPAVESSIGRILMNPGNRRGYATVRHKSGHSVAVSIGGKRPVAGLAYAQIPRDGVSMAARDLKTIVDLIDEMMR